MQNVQVSLLPFHLHRKTLQVPEGLTIKDYVDHLFPKKIRGVDIVVNIGDEVVPKNMWARVRPKPMTLIGINAIPAGGKGKKNPLATILSIALIVAAPYVVGALAPALAASFVGTVGPYTAAQYALASGIIKVGLGLVGFLATSMLSSTPKQRSRETSPREGSTQFIEGSSNKIDRFGVIPVNLGVNRMFPPQAALPYTETVANKQFVRQLFTYGFGKVMVTDRRIGETLLNEYQGVEIEDRLNEDLANGTSIYSNDVFQEGFSVVVSNAAGYITRTTQRNVDEASIDLTFTNGLVRYTFEGKRGASGVNFVVQFAPTGTNNWSSAGTPTAYLAQNVTIVTNTYIRRVGDDSIGYRILVLDIYTGVVSSLNYINVNDPPPIPENKIRIASCQIVIVGLTSTITNLIDERASYIGKEISGSGSFLPTYSGSGNVINIAAGSVGSVIWRIIDATSQALRVSKRLKFPNNGQYDVRIKRIQNDTVDETVQDVATLTALRSVKYIAPVNQAHLSGTAMRMQASDQLNGTVSSYNAIVSTLMKDYDADSNTWVDNVVTSNPASIYRYVLQSNGFVKRLADNRINLEKLKEWHIYCTSKGLTYNRVIDFETSIDDLLNDIAAAGMATPHKIDGVYSVLIDNQRPLIKGMVTPRNSWGYSGQITYPDLPHALRVQFRNENKGYNTDERIVYADGYNEGNAELFERLDFPSCTNQNLAWFYGRMYLATAILQPEVHTFNMDFENLTFNRGDKIIFVNDTILVGVGQGRIASLTDNGTHVTGFTLDETVTIPTTDQFGVRIRHGDASEFTYHSLVTVVGETDTFIFNTPVLIADAPPVESLCAFTQFGSELELLITEITMNKDHSARIAAVNYAPERFDAVTGEIPPFNSNVTIPLDFYRPLPPTLAGSIKSDESVMLRNSDGSYTGRMVIPLINPNERSVGVIVKIRPSGATQWATPDLLDFTPEQVVITGLEDGSSYDITVAYQRPSGLQLLSAPLNLNSVVYIGASSLPANVSNFTVNSNQALGLFEWDPNEDIDLSHYVIKFTRLTTGATWSNASLLADNILTNRFATSIQAGTYLIKAVDILNNESADATTIVSVDNGAYNNVVELLQGQPDWSGTLVNTRVYNGSVYLTSPPFDGEYRFDEFDLGDVYECMLSSSLEAVGVSYVGIRDVSSIRSLASVRGEGGNIVRTLTSIRSVGSIRGISPSDWAAYIEIAMSDDGISYTNWARFVVGKYTFRYLRVQVVLQSQNLYISPRLDSVEMLIDMPDRYESGENISCPPTGAIVTYSAEFKNNPAVNITLQNGAVDDRIEFVYKNSTGFHVKVYNQTSAGYVTRSLDYNSTGYGRVIV